MKLKQQIEQHERNEFISFDADVHTYTYSCGTRNENFGGVTSWFSKYFQPFDAEKIAGFIAYRDGISVDEVFDSWDMARGYGNYLDTLIGGYINEGKYKQMPEVQFFIQAMKEKNLTPLKSEWVIYDEDINRASAIDVICSNENDELVVVDLKSMEKEIKKEGYKGATMSYPLNNLQDAKFYKQSLQVSTYQHWLNNKYGLPVADEGYVLRIRPDFYEWIQTENLEEEIIKLYEFENE